MITVVSQPGQISRYYQSQLNGQYQYPSTEVPEKSVRRRFTAEYKLRILQEADICSQRGQISALLNREGLYFSNLMTWRRQREQGQLQALTDNKRGRKSRTPYPLKAKSEWLRQEDQQLQAENEQLRRENQQLVKRLKQAELMVDIQKKASEILLKTSLSPIESDESG